MRDFVFLPQEALHPKALEEEAFIGKHGAKKGCENRRRDAACGGSTEARGLGDPRPGRAPAPHSLHSRLA